MVGLCPSSSLLSRIGLIIGQFPLHTNFKLTEHSDQTGLKLMFTEQGISLGGNNNYLTKRDCNKADGENLWERQMWWNFDHKTAADWISSLIQGVMKGTVNCSRYVTSSSQPTVRQGFHYMHIHIYFE